MASVEKNTLAAGATLSPASDMMPRAKAMSVAMGTAQPLVAPPQLSSVYIRAGAATPPQAARMGIMAWRGLVKTPAVSSYLSSMPTDRKKMAIKKSLIKPSTEMLAIKGPSVMARGCSRSSNTG